MTIVPEHIRTAAAADAPANDRPADEPGAAPSSPAAPIDYHAEAKDLVEFAFACFEPLYPSIAPIYTPEARARIAGAAAPVMQKYSFNLGRFGPEIMLAVTVWPFVIPTMKAVHHDNEALKHQGEAQAVAPSEHKSEGVEYAAGAAPAASNDNGRRAHAAAGQFSGASRPVASTSRRDSSPLSPFAHGLKAAA